MSEEIERYDARTIGVENKFELFRRWRNHPNFHKLNATQAKALWVIFDMLSGTGKDANEASGRGFLECWYNNASLASEIGFSCSSWKSLGSKGSRVTTQLSELGFIERSSGRGTQKVWALVHTKDMPPALRLRKEDVEGSACAVDTPPEEHTPPDGQRGTPPHGQRGTPPHGQKGTPPEEHTEKRENNRVTRKETENRGKGFGFLSFNNPFFFFSKANFQGDVVGACVFDDTGACVLDTGAGDLAEDTHELVDATGAPVLDTGAGADAVLDTATHRPAHKEEDMNSDDFANEFIGNYSDGLELAMRTIRTKSKTDDLALDKTLHKLVKTVHSYYGASNAHQMVPEIMRAAELNAMETGSRFEPGPYFGWIIKQYNNGNEVPESEYRRIEKADYPSLFETRVCKKFDTDEPETEFKRCKNSWFAFITREVYQAPIGKDELKAHRIMNGLTTTGHTRGKSKEDLTLDERLELAGNNCPTMAARFAKQIHEKCNSGKLNTAKKHAKNDEGYEDAEVLDYETLAKIYVIHHPSLIVGK